MYYYLFSVSYVTVLWPLQVLLFRWYRIIHEHGYTTDECLAYRPVVFSNVTQSLIAIVRAASQLSIAFEHPEREVSIVCLPPSSYDDRTIGLYISFKYVTRCDVMTKSKMAELITGYWVDCCERFESRCCGMTFYVCYAVTSYLPFSSLYLH